MSGVNSVVFGHWNYLTNALGITKNVRDTWWSIIERRYSEDWRFYHTMAHLEHLLQLYDQWRERIAELENMLLSIFFHDIVYDPASSDNELRSIEVFTKFALDAGLAESVVQRIASMVTATISHFVESENDDLDLRLFLDFDLAVLGQDTDAYSQYADNIRKEYIHLDDETYRTGRYKVLQSLLNFPALYTTEEFREEYEEQARKNISREIASLGP